jgi:hypothetical protein
MGLNGSNIERSGPTRTKILDHTERAERNGLERSIASGIKHRHLCRFIARSPAAFYGVGSTMCE